MQTITSSLAVHDPLETLVVSQIAALRQFEADLKNQMTQHGSSEKIARMVDSLRVRAERLNRMIDAMAVGGSFAEAAAVPMVA